MFPRPDFFRGARLNFAENLLYPAPGLVGTVVDDPDAPAVLTVTERFEGMDGATPLGEEPVTTSWDQLRAAVAECAAALRRQLTTVDGSLLSEGKVVVAGFVSNHVQALVAMLASAAIGAVWTSISPDSGVGAVLDRLEQVGPVVLFADNATVYNGKVWSSTEKTERIVASLVKKGLRLAVIIQNVADVDLGIEKLKAEGLDVQEYESFLAR